MNTTTQVVFIMTIIILAATAVCGQPTTKGTEETMQIQEPIDLRIGGCGGVYFLASPGTLEIELAKWDRHRWDKTTDLRAILVGPDRDVIEDVTVPDDGREKGSGFGPPQYAHLSTEVESKGVYALNITVSNDRYGQEIAWGFRTNCEHYLIETSRGHKDARHEEPIVLLNGDEPMDVCFHPPDRAFDIEFTQLPDEVEELTVHDNAGTLLATIPVENKEASYAFEQAESRENIPWRLHVSNAYGTLQIGGVTRWERGDQFTNLSLWSPDADSWFSLMPNRWILTPYHRQIYGDPGEQGTLDFRVHNNAATERTIALETAFPREQFPVSLEQNSVTLDPGGATTVEVTYTVPETESAVCHLRATPQDGSGFTTYSSLIVKAGQAQVDEPLDLPLQLRPYEHENEQFGYNPQYPLENQMYFDIQNRPWVGTSRGLATIRDGEWVRITLDECEIRASEGVSTERLRPATEQVAFDADNDVYIVARNSNRQDLLLHSADGARTFDATLIPPHEKGRGGFDLEVFTGHNTHTGPPAITRATRTGGQSEKYRWRRVSDLELFTPKKTANGIEIGDPVLISEQALGVNSHSGIPPSVVSDGSKVHIAWGEATDPEKEVPGVPAYAATYDKETTELTEPALIGYGPPPNDVHNTAAITIDGEGYLHVLGGTHGRPFPYARSLEPNTAAGGFTEATRLGEGLHQTYIGLVCTPDNAVHTAFRLWRFNEEPFPNASFATLAYQKRPEGGPWSDPTILVQAAFSNYSIFYHRLTIDRRGRLFLSKDYWSTYWFYRTDHVGDRRSVLMSPDRGETWKLATMEDLQPDTSG